MPNYKQFPMSQTGINPNYIASSLKLTRVAKVERAIAMRESYIEMLTVEKVSRATATKRLCRKYGLRYTAVTWILQNRCSKSDHGDVIKTCEGLS